MLGARGVPSVGSTLVLVISRNTSTARDLRAYFQQCGVTAVVSDHLDPPDGGPPVTSVVVFPDEFPAQSAALGVLALARRHSNSTMVIVTRDVERFETLGAQAQGKSPGRWFVLPRPIWGWALLDRVLQPGKTGDVPDEEP